MGRVLVYFGRFALIFVGYVAASLAGSAFLHLISFGLLGIQPDEMPRIVMGTGAFSIPFIALFVAYFAFLPAVPAILLSEVFGYDAEETGHIVDKSAANVRRPIRVVR